MTDPAAIRARCLAASDLASVATPVSPMEVVLVRYLRWLSDDAVELMRQLELARAACAEKEKVIRTEIVK